VSIVRRIVLWLLLLGPALPLLSLELGCKPRPTPPAPLSPAEQKKYEEDLKKKRDEEGKSLRNN
jgi:hypothetical protein